MCGLVYSGAEYALMAGSWELGSDASGCIGRKFVD
jgi:hypothetical protein